VIKEIVSGKKMDGNSRPHTPFDEKPLKFREFETILCNHLPSNVLSNLFRFSECLDLLLEKENNSPFMHPVLSPEICNTIFF
jgi:hypothetical protein